MSGEKLHMYRFRTRSTKRISRLRVDHDHSFRHARGINGVMECW